MFYLITDLLFAESWQKGFQLSNLIDLQTYGAARGVLNIKRNDRGRYFEEPGCYGSGTRMLPTSEKISNVK